MKIKNNYLLKALQNFISEEKRYKICLIKAENAVNSRAMCKFSNEKQADFTLFNLFSRFCKAFLLLIYFSINLIYLWYIYNDIYLSIKPILNNFKVKLLENE